MKRFLAFVLALTAGFWLGIRVAQGPAGEPVAVSPTQATNAQAYLDENLPPMPNGWEWDLFAPRRGIALEVGRAPADDPRGTILFLPGYTAPLDMYGAELERMRAAGWSIAALSYRGQGRSERFGPDGQMGWVDDYANLADDVSAFAATLDGPVGIFAISKGGHIALRTMLTDPDAAQAVALVAPMIAINTDPFPEGVARALSRSFTVIGLGDTYAFGRGPWDDAGVFDDPANLAVGGTCARDPARAHLREALFALDTDLRVGGPAARWVDATYASTDLVRRSAAKISVPVHLTTAGQDKVVRSEVASALCRDLGNCTEVEIEDALHCMIEDAADTRTQIIDNALEFFDLELSDIVVE